MIHLLRDFYINADRFGYTVGILSANNERERVRDAIAAGDVRTLQEAVQELRCIRDEIITAVGGKEV